MEFDPPRPLSIVARKIWDQHCKRIHSEGRWQVVDLDLLCTYAETVEIYLRCKSDIDDHGVLVQGRTEKELVRNPALTPLNQARTALIVLAKGVPLANRNADVAGATVDAYIDEMCK